LFLGKKRDILKKLRKSINQLIIVVSCNGLAPLYGITQSSCTFFQKHFPGPIPFRPILYVEDYFSLYLSFPFAANSRSFNVFSVTDPRQSQRLESVNRSKREDWLPVYELSAKRTASPTCFSFSGESIVMSEPIFPFDTVWI